MEAANDCLNTLKKIQAFEQELLRSSAGGHRNFDTEDVQRGADSSVFTQRGSVRSPLSELAVVDAVNTFFSMVSEEKQRRLVFERLFMLPNNSCVSNAPSQVTQWSSERQALRLHFLASMTSVAVSTWLSPPLELVASWLRCHIGTPVHDFTRTLTDDLLSLDRPASVALRDLPRANANFVEAYITALTEAYTFKEVSFHPPAGLLALVIVWITDYRGTVLRGANGNVVSGGARSRSALFGLIRWTVTAALHFDAPQLMTPTMKMSLNGCPPPSKKVKLLTYIENKDSDERDRNDAKVLQLEMEDPRVLISKLQLKLLIACDTASSSNVQQTGSNALSTPLHQAELLEFTTELGRTVLQLDKNVTSSSTEELDVRVELAVTRLAQIVQLIWVNNLLNANKDALRVGLGTLPQAKCLKLMIEHLK